MNKIYLTFCVFIGIYCFNSLSFAKEYSSLRKNSLSCNFEENALPDVSGAGAYIIPNEYNNNQYGDILKKIEGDLMISVGSLRSFIIYGLSNFKLGIFIDYDKKAVAFNRNLLDLMVTLFGTGIPVKHQRWQFISLLTSDLMLTDQQLKKMELADEKESRKIRNLLEGLKNKTVELQKPTHELTNIISSIHANIGDVERFKSQIIYYYYLNEDMQNLEMNNEILYQKQSYNNYKLSNELSRYFWESDEQWLKLINAALENRIAIIGRSVSDPQFYQELDRCLNEINAQIGLLDFSNIPSFGQKYLGKDGKRLLISAVKVLPKSASSQLFFTSKNYYDNKDIMFVSSQSLGHVWLYHYLSLLKIELINEI